MRHRHVGAGIVRRHDGVRGDRLGMPVDQHQGHLFGHQALDDGIVAAHGGEDQAVHLPATQHRHSPLLARQFIICIGENDAEVACGQRVFDAAKNEREERVGDIGDKRADHGAALRAQRAGDAVRLVATLHGQRLDALADLRLRTRATVEGWTPARRPSSLSVEDIRPAFPRSSTEQLTTNRAR